MVEVRSFLTSTILFCIGRIVGVRNEQTSTTYVNNSQSSLMYVMLYLRDMVGYVLIRRYKHLIGIWEVSLFFVFSVLLEGICHLEG